MDSSNQIYKYLLKQNNQVVELITHSLSLHKRKSAIKPIINQYVNCCWQVSEISSKEITIIVPTSEYANRLRFRSAQLLCDIRKLESFKLLTNLNIKVRPTIFENYEQKKPNKKGLIHDSKGGKKHLLSLAESVDDPALKTSLQNLANHLSK